MCSKKTKVLSENSMVGPILNYDSNEFRERFLSCLDEGGQSPELPGVEDLKGFARKLKQALLDLQIDGEVVEIMPGPFVTTYKFSLSPGVKLNSLPELEDELCVALNAISVRIAKGGAPGVIGFEIANQNRETAFLKKILSSEAFVKSRSRLPVAIGKDVIGQEVVFDFATMPHMLIAGASGTGKSVLIHSMILSLVYSMSPRDLRMIIVDPKMLELQVYNDMPHLLLPVVTNPKKAILALNWMLKEMQRRYGLMAEEGVRNIKDYNRNMAKQDRNEDHLPTIVLFVDELADLMLVAKKQVEEAVARLAAMSRAAGIHMVLATQRPSPDVISGLIKVNFPVRVAFKVFSRTDSRTILDQRGAETMIGQGDMLFLPPASSVLKRFHGSFVSDDEVVKVVSFLKEQAVPDYDHSILKKPKVNKEKVGSQANNREDEVDERWGEALALVAKVGKASISMLQSRLRIGYNRAVRLIEKMEREGIVGPADGSGRARDVLVKQPADKTDAETSKTVRPASPSGVDSKVWEKALKQRNNLEVAFVQYLQVTLGVSQKDAKLIVRAMRNHGYLKF